MTRRRLDSVPSRGPAPLPPAGETAGLVRFTVADGYRSVMSALMVVLGVVILARTLAFGFHLTAVLVGMGFIGLGAYRLAFVFAYLRRAAGRSR